MLCSNLSQIINDIISLLLVCFQIANCTKYCTGTAVCVGGCVCDDMDGLITNGWHPSHGHDTLGAT